MFARHSSSARARLTAATISVTTTLLRARLHVSSTFGRALLPPTSKLESRSRAFSCSTSRLVMVPTIKFHDGNEAPFLAFGNGKPSPEDWLENLGPKVVRAGFTHIDTAQGYGNDQQEITTGELLRREGKVGKIFITSKVSERNNYQDAIPLNELETAVRKSVKDLGVTPNLYLIHNPFMMGDASGKAENVQTLWKILEDLKDEGILSSIGVSNFRPQDMKAVLDICRHKPVMNQVEFHPYLLAHMEPLLQLQKEHGILTGAYTPLRPVINVPDGRLTPVLEDIAARHTKRAGKKVDPAAVLLLWCKAVKSVAVVATERDARIHELLAVASLPDLEQSDVDEICRVGRQVHYRFYQQHMTRDFPAPDLPSK